MARQGAMVAYQGNVDFAFEGGGASKFIKKALTGEGLPLMRCQGQGDVFLAERAYDVHLLNLNNAGLSISGKNVLAFSSSLDWNIERVKGGSIVDGRAVQHDVARHRLGGADHRRPAGRAQRGRGADLRRHQRGGGVVGEPADAAEDELQGGGADRSRFRRGGAGFVLRARASSSSSPPKASRSRRPSRSELEEEGDRAVVDQVDLHVGAEATGRHVGAEPAESGGAGGRPPAAPRPPSGRGGVPRGRRPRPCRRRA